MKKIITFIIALTLSLQVAGGVSANLVQNPTYGQLDASGNVLNWNQGGYGVNTSNHAVIHCNPDLIQKYPTCPPYTSTVLQVSSDPNSWIDGDVKWYFDDVPLTKRLYVLKYQYQAYTYSGRVIARYTYGDGHYSYDTLVDMPQLSYRAMGYVDWQSNEVWILAPQDATSMTIFFALSGRGNCSNSFCNGSSRGELSIANVNLE